MLSNWIANREMKRLLKDISNNPSVESLKFNFSELYDLFFPKFKKVKDCIIISKKSVDELEMFFDRSVKRVRIKQGMRLTVQKHVSTVILKVKFL